ncbi:hypothetical protein [Bosea sp. (in: a-proteobacteria)]|uniref:hypothetical protein n=1 Tax=Bosea sp. (in: a-proteobacteria) TaxID=1871050 RepID=UPI002FC5FEA8
MIREEDLQAAVSEGIIDQAQAVRLSHLARLRRQAAPFATGDVAAEDSRPVDPDDERFRLIGGFNDVFVTIGVGLLAAALLGLMRLLGLGEAFALTGLVAAWGLAEWFSRRMRLALPSIALAVMFVASAGFLAALATDLLAQQAGIRGEARQGWLLIGGGLAGALAARLHHWRFRVPIDAAITAAGCVTVLAGLLTLVDPRLVEDHLAALAFVVGVGIFLFAMRADMSDPRRLTRRSDSAFWLHLLAAPLIVHPTIQLATGGIGDIGTGKALVVLVLFVLLGLVALVIDRRALIVSGLSYAGIAIAYLLAQRLEGGLGLPLTLLGLAVVVLGLSAGWRALRTLVVSRLPLGALAERLPPVASQGLS